MTKEKRLKWRRGWMEFESIRLFELLIRKGDHTVRYTRSSFVVRILSCRRL